MKKQNAIELFGSVREMAKAMGITPQAIYQWPNKLPQEQADRVIGAAVRIGKVQPCDHPMPRMIKGRAA